MRPARVALLAPGAERDDLGLALRPARALERDVERKQDFVKRCISESPLPARDRAGDQAGEIGFRAAEAVGVRRRDVDGDVAAAAPAAATPSRPSAPRASGMIASGPASPARPTPPAPSGK